MDLKLWQVGPKTSPFILVTCTFFRTKEWIRIKYSFTSSLWLVFLLYYNCFYVKIYQCTFVISKHNTFPWFKILDISGKTSMTRSNTLERKTYLTESLHDKLFLFSTIQIKYRQDDFSYYSSLFSRPRYFLPNFICETKVGFLFSIVRNGVSKIYQKLLSYTNWVVQLTS